VRLVSLSQSKGTINSFSTIRFELWNYVHLCSIITTEDILADLRLQLSRNSSYPSSYLSWETTQRRISLSAFLFCGYELKPLALDPVQLTLTACHLRRLPTARCRDKPNKIMSVEPLRFSRSTLPVKKFSPFLNVGTATI
jgi:hypothetical protein